MCYHRITLPVRYQLQALHDAHHRPQEMAAQLGLHRSTVTRELARVSPYTAETAHQHAQQEEGRRHAPRILPAVWDTVTTRLKEFHSPEQIHGRLVLEGQFCPSVERIYLHVHALPALAQFLRRGRLGRQRHSARRNKADLWQSITQRPHAANERAEIGHLEADLMEGQKGKGSLVVMEDRCSRFVLLNLVLHKTALEVFSAMDSVLDGQQVKTITIDQGREFVLTEHLGQQWGAATYACHAHSPWEKGSVENTNGLLRQFFPKGTDFTLVTLETVLAVQHRLNNRPRKVVGYRTPHEVHSAHQSGALAT